MSGEELVRKAVDRLADRHDLAQEEAAAVLAAIMAGEVSEQLIAAFLIALRTKGETPAELAGLAATMRQLAAKVEVDRDPLLDTAGTGGGRFTYNVSTTAALIAAAAGIAVAKHGNRSATSSCGSADLLEAVGARIDLGPAAVAEAIQRCNFGFMFAPVHHQATRFVAPVRRALGVRTVFNLLGPLTNPAGAKRQLIGVSNPAQLELVAGALQVLGSEHALVVSSADGLDEVSAFAPTQAIELRDGELQPLVLLPQELGLSGTGQPPPGGPPAYNAELVKRVLAGSEQGSARDLAVANAAAAIYVAGKAETVREGAQIAAEVLKEGRALELLDRYVKLTREL